MGVAYRGVQLFNTNIHVNNKSGSKNLSSQWLNSSKNYDGIQLEKRQIKSQTMMF